MTILVNSVVSGGGANYQMIISTYTADQLTALAAGTGGLTTEAMEETEYASWLAKVEAAGVTIGGSLAP